jgi:hypothetical protein
MGSVRTRSYTMKLLTKAIEKKLPPIFSQTGKGDDAIAQVKFFSIGNDWTWYATEYDPAERMFYGLVNGWEQECGPFSLTEFEDINKRYVLGIERDMYWTPKSLRECRREVETRRS